LWFIDNLGVLSCLCNGSSTVADISCIVHATLLAVAGLRSAVWWEHVDSKANLADGGTRGSARFAEALGIPLTARAVPPWPLSPLAASPDAWLQWLELQPRRP